MAPVPPDAPRRNADVYYRSAQVSAVRRLGSEGSRKPVIVADPKPEDRSTDKYYRAGGGRPRLVMPADPPAAPPAAAPVAAAAGQVTVRVGRAEEIRLAVDAVCDALAGGNEVELQVTDPALVMPVRTQLDLMVTRQRISEGQYRDVRLVVPETRTVRELFGEPVPIPTPPPADDDVAEVDDFLAKLAGGGSATVTVAEPEAEAEAEAEPAEDNDFFR